MLVAAGAVAQIPANVMDKNPHSARVGILGLFDEVDGALEEAVEGLAL